MPGSVTCSFIGHPLWQGYNGLVSPGHIHILHGSTSAFVTLSAGLFALLDTQEKQRASRYYHLQDQQGYIVRHGLLRLLLGSRVNRPAPDLAFVFNPNKKPGLSPQQHLYFNISHSAGHFLIAISDREVGIDLELIEPAFEYRDIAGNYFSAPELSYIDTAPDPLRAFFLLWTRKEALLKACGMGIDDDLPAVPASDGKGMLPSNYPRYNWLTESFTVGDVLMGSVTYAEPKAQLHFTGLTAGDVAALLNAG